MAENHPVGFQWVVEARERGAKVIHVDPRFNRTSAMADIWVPLRAGSDIRVSGRPHPLCDRERQGFPRLRPALHQRFGDPARRVSPTPKTWTAFSPAGTKRKSNTDPETWAYKGAPEKDTDGRRGQRGGHAKDRGGEQSDESIYETGLTLQHPRCVYQVLKRHFSRYTPEHGRRGMRGAAEAFSQGGGGVLLRVRAREDRRDLLRGGVDAALQRRPDHPRSGDPAVAAGQYRTPWRRHSRTARPRLHSRLHGHSHPVRHSSRLSPHAVFRGATRRSFGNISSAQSENRLVEQSSTSTLSAC